MVADSFIVHGKTKDIYEDIAKNIRKMFVTSDCELQLLKEREKK